MQGDAFGSLFGLLFGCFCMAISLGLFAHWIWMLVDCVTNEPSEGSDKIVWILVIVLAGGIGSLVYYFIRRPQRISLYGK